MEQLNRLNIKKCSKCNELKSINEFYNKKSICKDCYKLNCKSYYLSHKDIYKIKVKKQKDEGYYKEYYQKNKERMKDQHKIWIKNNTKKWKQINRKNSLKQHKKNYVYTTPIKIKCEMCGKEIVTVCYHQKYCKECRRKSMNRKTEARRRNLKWKILFTSPFDKTEEIHYHHITLEYVIPLPADIHSCYYGYHTRNNNEDLDYIIEQIYPSFSLIKESIRKN